RIGQRTSVDITHSLSRALLRYASTETATGPTIKSGMTGFGAVARKPEALNASEEAAQSEARIASRRVMGEGERGPDEAGGAPEEAAGEACMAAGSLGSETRFFQEVCQRVSLRKFRWASGSVVRACSAG